MRACSEQRRTLEIGAIEAPKPGGILKSIIEGLWRSSPVEFFLLRRAEKEAISHSDAIIARTRAYAGAGDLRMRAASNLIDSEPIAALVLCREAAVLHMAAFLTLHGQPPLEPVIAADVITLFEKTPAWTSERHGEVGVELLEIVKSSAPMTFDRLPPREIARLWRSFGELVSWLRARNDIRPLKQIKRHRLLRFGALGLFGLAFVYWRLVYRHPHDYLHRIAIFGALIGLVWGLIVVVRSRAAKA